jgi:hypothetical protein
MKISLWQQFSSNHSSKFTVVGRFQSAEAAEEVGERFRTLFVSIDEWLTQWLAEKDEALKQAEAMETDLKKRMERFVELFPDVLNKIGQPERDFMQQYNVHWEESIDWLWGDYNPAQLVKVIGSDVLVMTNTNLTEQKPTSVRDAMMTWGAQATVVCEEGDSRSIGVYLSCLAPSEEIAEQIFSIIQANIDYIRDSNTRFGVEYEYPLEPLTEPPRPWIASDLALRHDNDDYEYQIGSGRNVQRNGLELSCELQFYRTGFGLPAFIDWLTSQGCTHIQYRLTEESEWIIWQR